MPQRILNRNEIQLLRGMVRNYRLPFSSNEKEKVLKSLQNKIDDLFKSFDETDQVTISTYQPEHG